MELGEGQGRGLNFPLWKMREKQVLVYKYFFHALLEVSIALCGQ
jgi:hypothetical protein